MAKPITQEQFRDLWRAEFVRADLCGLCGNSGTIDTRGVRSAAGVLCGDQFFCLCPNGRAIKKAYRAADADTASAKDRSMAHLVCRNWTKSERRPPMSNPHKLAVGQKLWFVETDHMGRARGGSLREVTKVGRQWAHLGDNLRISMETLKADSPDYSLARAYLSKEAFDAENALVRAWDQFLRACQHRGLPPAGVTVENIAEAARLLCVKPFP